MAISHLSSGEVASLLPLGDMLEQTPTTALFKEERLEVMRIVLPAGTGMPVHAVDGPVTVQCIEGEVDLEMNEGHQILRTGDLVYLASGVPHALTSFQNSSILVTVVLARAAELQGIAGERRKHHDDNLETKWPENE
ncbi:cupin domain-containing protein [Paraburkholderia sediminicola]|uniref:Cupin domain-containing protein n=1 Tax=Paraburkholderia rhynchosiae TaxID=487049 RepID=A0ACC7NIU5_9BURK